VAKRIRTHAMSSLHSYTKQDRRKRGVQSLDRGKEVDICVSCGRRESANGMGAVEKRKREGCQGRYRFCEEYSHRGR